MSHTYTYAATGLTCGHCAHAVAQEVGQIDGVTGVDVDVVNGGASSITVTAESEPSQEHLAAALDEAGGYALVDA